VAIFDFDGTISLLRAGWHSIMTRMMVEGLLALGTGESRQELETIVRAYVFRLTGLPTIEQMNEFARQLTARGARAEHPRVYKEHFAAQLGQVVAERTAEIRRTGDARSYVVPGTYEWLDQLRARGLTLYIASGTDHDELVAEAELLGFEPYFGDRVYGALAGDGARAKRLPAGVPWYERNTFEKRDLMAWIMARGEARGEQILCFGDGVTEIVAVKEVGGLGVGVATDEPDCRRVEPGKRERLIACGADWIIPHYQPLNELRRELWKQ
jgi:phosphoglycolate phosphatase-like HAD superfamily hydrolase